MSFASAYLDSGALFTKLIDKRPRHNTGAIVVIPAFNEPDIADCLDSLAAAFPASLPSEVIVVINAPSDALPDELEGTRKSVAAIERWIGENGGVHFDLHIIDADSSVVKKWGVGAARKTGMDEAVRRFGYLGNREGVIASLDADCEVSSDYFRALTDDFGSDSLARACSIRFRHREAAEGRVGAVSRAIMEYELHMRYFVNALRYTGFPHCYHTIGSAMAVKAVDYVKSGGMNRRQGGEDFYFIQKLVAQGGYQNLNSTTVYPSPRLSVRVPFGTGPAIKEMISSGRSDYLTYDFDSFRPLKRLFELVRSGSGSEGADILCYSRLPEEIRLFTGEDEWRERIEEIVANTSGSSAFVKRYFNWFNAFRIVRYLNMMHEEKFERIPVRIAAGRLAMHFSWQAGSDTVTLLEYFREIDGED